MKTDHITVVNGDQYIAIWLGEDITIRLSIEEFRRLVRQCNPILAHHDRKREREKEAGAACREYAETVLQGYADSIRAAEGEGGAS